MWDTHSATHKGVKSLSLERAHNRLNIGDPRTQGSMEKINRKAVNTQGVNERKSSSENPDACSFPPRTL